MLTFLFDENLPRKILAAVRRHNATNPPCPINALAVGLNPAPPYGTLDPELLEWLGTEGRLLVTRDIRSMPSHLADHLAAGGTCPGILELRLGSTVPEVVELLQLIAHAGLPTDYENAIVFIP